LSDADSFIQEVSEEVRRDRLNRAVRRWAPLGVAAVVAVVAATAVLAWRDHSREQSARAAGEGLLRATAAASPAERAGGLIALLETAEGGQATLARLRLAGELAAEGDAPGAVAAYRAVADDAATSPAFAAFAAYRAAVVGAEQAGAAATIELLNPLTGEGQPFRLLALEARAAQRVRLDDTAAALADLDAILADPAATEETILRARELRASIGDAREAAQ
jgi:hypothetical protein